MFKPKYCFGNASEKGLLYMWGKNSHTILADKPTTHKIFLPHGVNKNFRGGRISKIWCGSWHAVAQIGRPGNRHFTVTPFYSKC